MNHISSPLSIVENKERATKTETFLMYVFHLQSCQVDMDTAQFRLENVIIILQGMKLIKMELHMKYSSNVTYGLVFSMDSTFISL